jgi:Flp pilus assembly protein protease CpaA
VSARRPFAAIRANAGSWGVALAACLGVLGVGAMSAADAKPVTVADLLAGSPPADWRTPNPDDTLYLELPADVS